MKPGGMSEFSTLQLSLFKKFEKTGSRGRYHLIMMLNWRPFG